MKTMKIDVMILGGAKFLCTLTYQYNPLFKVKYVDVLEYVYQKRPSLKYRKDVHLYLYN